MITSEWLSALSGMQDPGKRLWRLSQEFVVAMNNITMQGKSGRVWLRYMQGDDKCSRQISTETMNLIAMQVKINRMAANSPKIIQVSQTCIPLSRPIIHRIIHLVGRAMARRSIRPDVIARREQ